MYGISLLFLSCYHYKQGFILKISWLITLIKHDTFKSLFKIVSKNVLNDLLDLIFLLHHFYKITRVPCYQNNSKLYYKVEFKFFVKKLPFVAKVQTFILESLKLSTIIMPKLTKKVFKTKKWHLWRIKITVLKRTEVMPKLNAFPKSTHSLSQLRIIGIRGF